MTLADLKNSIIDPDTFGSVNGFIVLKCDDNHFLADQYLETIEKDNQYFLNKISSIFEPSSSALSLVFDYENRINVLRVAEFNEYADNYDELGNIIVVCDKIDKKIEAVIKPYIIKIPKLQTWQIQDYVTVNTGLTNEMAEKLVEVSKADIYKVTNEIDKLKMFSKEEQPYIFSELLNDPVTDLYDQSLLDISSAMLKGDRITVLNGLLHRQLLDMDPFWLVSLLLGNYKKILYINFNSGLGAEDLKMTPKQVNAIKYYYKHISLKQVQEAIEVLTDIDIKIKSGDLILDQDYLFDYIMNKVMV